MKLDIIRDRNSLYRETNMGLVENVYMLKIINMDEHEHRYSLHIDGLETAELIGSQTDITVPAGELMNLSAKVRIDPVNLKNTSSEIRFTLRSTDTPGITTTQGARFVGPTAGLH